MMIRMIVAMVCALLVTLSLLWGMQFLITTADHPFDNSVTGRLLEFVKIEKLQRAQPDFTRPKKPPVPQSPPSGPSPIKLDYVVAEPEMLAIAPVDVNSQMEQAPQEFDFGEGEGDYLPLVKVAPIYPRRAISRGMEGSVVLEFTVTRRGSVKDVRVLEPASSSNIFHKAAINAALKFKYKPRVINGEAVEVTGVRNMMTFKLLDQ